MGIDPKLNHLSIFPLNLVAPAKKESSTEDSSSDEEEAKPAPAKKGNIGRG